MTQQNLILANPAADLELSRLEKRLPRYILSVDEVEQILAQPDLTTHGGIRDRALMEVLWSTGIRRGEAAVLEVYSVDANRRTLTIVQGKGKQDRVVPVGERALWWIQHYLHHVRPRLLVNPHCKALFITLDGVEGLGPNGITNTYIRRCRYVRSWWSMPAPIRQRTKAGMTIWRITIIMTTQMTPHKEIMMSSTIHFRIDEETKRLAMQAAERQQMSLTELMRQRAEELAAEERRHQNNEHEGWLEAQIAQAFSRYEAGEGEYISNDEMENRMKALKQRAARGTL